jgi:enoyl-CoA hydratase/carnithine racemase
MHDEIPVEELEFVDFSVVDGVAWVVMNRPEVLNAFNYRMQLELRSIWRGARRDEDIRCLVLTGAGERAFSTGIDREEAMAYLLDEEGKTERIPIGSAAGDEGSAWHFDDPGQNIGPKANDLWKPVIAAVNGMACGGALYMLGEVDIVIAADHATFFDPHVTFGMTSCFEAMHLLQKMPFHEVMRVALMGSDERVSAKRAYEVGFVTEVVSAGELRDAADRIARTIARHVPNVIQGTVRSIWTAQDLGRKDALDLGKVLIRVGSRPDDLRQGQENFSQGQRVTPRIR